MSTDRLFTNEMFLRSLNREPQLFDFAPFDRTYGNRIANQRLLRDRFVAADEARSASKGADGFDETLAFCG